MHGFSSPALDSITYEHTLHSCRFVYLYVFFFTVTFRASGSMACLPRTWLFVVHSAWPLASIQSPDVDATSKKCRSPKRTWHALQPREREWNLRERISFSEAKIIYVELREHRADDHEAIGGKEIERSWALSAVTRELSIKDVVRNGWPTVLQCSYFIYTTTTCRLRLLSKDNIFITVERHFF